MTSTDDLEEKILAVLWEVRQMEFSAKRDREIPRGAEKGSQSDDESVQVFSSRLVMILELILYFVKLPVI